MTTEDMVRLVMTAAAAAAVLLAAGCTTGAGHGAAAPGGSPGPLPAAPRTAAALLKIATAFNDDYQGGDYAPVYARWDARSQAIITQADYVLRNQECRSGACQTGWNIRRRECWLLCPPVTRWWVVAG
jgi:hypothetical protein